MKRSSELWKVMLPYCLERLEDGRYILLNRNYKPVGYFGNEAWVRYEDFPGHCYRIKLPKKTIEALSHNGDSSSDNIYLYDDACPPLSSKESFTAYSRRLELLANRKVSISR